MALLEKADSISPGRRLVPIYPDLPAMQDRVA